MRRVVVLVLTMAVIAGLAVPVLAVEKERDAVGTTTFVNTPQCEPFVDCAISAVIMEIPLLNPATKTGTFKGTQVLTGVFLLDISNLSFTYSGTAVFNGRVKACGVGTVSMDVEGAGFLDPTTLNATFTTNDQVIDTAASSLPISGSLSETGTVATDADGNTSLEYEGDYICDHSG